MTATARAGPVDLVLVSDLHLGSEEAAGSGHDRAFGELLDAVTSAQARRGRAWRLVLLGDLLDFPVAAPRRLPSGSRGPGGRAAAVLDRVEEAAPASVSGLRRLVRAGTGIDVVAGNHDAELVHPAVQRAVAERLGARAGNGVAFHPWIYHVPGLLYAEHGSQHHDINRVGGLLGQVDRLGAGRARTPAAVLGRLRRAGARGGLAGAAATVAVPLAVAGSLLVTARADGARARAAYAAGPLRHHAAAVRLPVEVLRELDAVSSSSTLPMLRRIAWRAVARRLGREAPDYMEASASRVHAVLDAHGLATPFYVFGHTHDARCTPVGGAVPGAAAGGSSPLYLNTGCWSPLTRGRELAEQGSGAPTWVHLDATARRSRLGRWGVDEP